MSIRRELEKRIEKKLAEIADLERQIGESRAYVQALQDSLKLVPRESDTASSVAHILRPGSEVEKVRSVLKKAGKPLYITDILKAMGKENTKAHRLTISGSLSRYVREGKIFTRSSANTFGLVEFEVSEPPEGFGGMDESLASAT